MALKMTSTAWTVASEENKNLRNEHRENFFLQTGVKPAKSMRDIHIPLQSRVEQIKEQIEIAKNNHLGDENLTACAELAEAMLLLSGLGLPSLIHRPESQSFGLVALSPEILKRFFVSDQETSLERSLF